jgi:hypothetical protein
MFLNLIRILEYTLEVLTRYNGVDWRNNKQVLRWKRHPFACVLLKGVGEDILIF